MTWDEQAPILQGATRASRGDGALRGEHRLPRPGGVQAPLGMGGARPGLGTFVFIVPGRYVKTPTTGSIVLNRTAQSVVEAQRRQHANARLRVPRQPTTRMLNSAWLRRPGEGRTAAGPRPRLEAHLRAALAGRRRELRGSPGPARPSLRPDHHALLRCRAHKAPRSGEPRVRIRPSAARAGRLAAAFRGLRSRETPARR